MAARRPIVNVSGRRKELPVADTLDWGWLSGKPTTLGGYGIADGVTSNTAQNISGQKTFSANPIAYTPAEASAFEAWADSGEVADFAFFNGSGVRRWALRKNNTSESGANSGSGLSLKRYSDAGASLGDVFDVLRETGVLNFLIAPTITGNVVHHDGNYPVSEGATGGALAKRTASGDIETRLFRSTFANSATAVTGAIPYRVNDSGDNFIRFCSDAGELRKFLDTPCWSPTIAGTNSNYTLASTDRDIIRGKTDSNPYTYTVDPTLLEVGGFYYLCNYGALSNMTLAPSAGVTMRLTGTTTTGNRTLAPRGLARIWIRSAGEVWVDGPGVT